MTRGRLPNPVIHKNSIPAHQYVRRSCCRRSASNPVLLSPGWGVRASLVRTSEISTSGGAILWGRADQGAPPSLCSARQVGSKARDLLALPEFAGKVLAVLSDTIYLFTRDGEVIWICSERFPLHRRCILVLLPPKVVSGEKCFWQFPHLTFSGGPFIDLSTAREWNPYGSEARGSVCLTGLWACFRRLLGVLDLLEVYEGMGRAISLSRALAEGSAFPAFPPTSIMGRVQDLALDLAYACLDQDLRFVTRIGKEMIGLGPGLTPSGDDFLGGLFFAARSLHQAYPGDFFWDEDAVFDLLCWAKTRTHPISHAVFSDLALGHGPEPLHDLVGGLLAGRGFNSILEAALRVAAIGHSSGWDMLAGAATGMLMVKKSIEQSDKIS